TLPSRQGSGSESGIGLDKPVPRRIRSPTDREGEVEDVAQIAPGRRVAGTDAWKDHIPAARCKRHGCVLPNALDLSRRQIRILLEHQRDDTGDMRTGRARPVEGSIIYLTVDRRGSGNECAGRGDIQVLARKLPAGIGGDVELRRIVLGNVAD